MERAEPAMHNTSFVLHLWERFLQARTRAKKAKDELAALKGATTNKPTGFKGQERA